MAVLDSAGHVIKSIKHFPSFVLYNITDRFLFLYKNCIEKGRVDDNIETIRKRFKVFVESSLPVIEYYDSLGKVKKV